MKVFGPEPWGLAEGPDGIGMIPTPVDAPCQWCREPIEPGDYGVALSLVEEGEDRMLVKHRECFIRQIAGSVHHQLHACTCYGGRHSCNDTEGLTRRQDARAAMDIAMARVR